MAVDPVDSSYMPSLIVVSGGPSFTSLTELNEIHVRSTDMIVTLLKDVQEYYPCIEIAIKQCRNAGIDCKVHGLSIVGKRQKPNTNLKTSASFLASDWDQAYDQVTTLPYTSKFNIFYPFFESIKVAVCSFGEEREFIRFY